MVEPCARTKTRAQSAPIAEITLGRKTGREVSLPVQFVYEDARAFLLPFKGKVTNWYQDLVRNPTMKVSLSGTTHRGEAPSSTEAKKDERDDGDVRGEIR
jgi:hypothetical protein